MVDGMACHHHYARRSAWLELDGDAHVRVVYGRDCSESAHIHFPDQTSLDLGMAGSSWHGNIGGGGKLQEQRVVAEILPSGTGVAGVREAPHHKNDHPQLPALSDLAFAPSVDLGHHWKR